MAIDKPPCLHSAALPRGGGASVADLLRQYWPALTGVSPKAEDAGLVNRLDFETSGILVVARARQTWLELHRLLMQGKVQKTYLAVVEGRIEGVRRIESFITAAGRRAGKVRAVKRRPAGMRAMPALSLITPLGFDAKRNLSLVRFRIGPGRRHQIRAQSAHIGHPLAGDALYGAKSSLDDLLAAALPDRPRPAFLLHAESFGLRSPWDQSKLFINSRPPAYWPEFRHLRKR